MSVPSRLPKLAWLVPIVAVAFCALMVLPGGTFVASAQSASLRGAPSGSVGAPLHTMASAARSPSSLVASLSPTLQKVPWISSLGRTGPSLSPLTSLPNFALLQHPVTASAWTVNPFYVSQPAPLGVADYGLGATPYSYNVSHIMGEVTLAAPPNVTDPASQTLIEPGGAADGYVGSFNEFGVQLNTVATNMSIPGSDQGFFWTQNVYNWNDTGIHPVSDTFNLTSATQNPFTIAPGTIYSACGLTSQAAIDKVLANYGGVFQCVGGTIPVSPASYPVTMQLYNNASIDKQGRTQVAYGYRITEAGTGQVFTGFSDIVIFNADANVSVGMLNKPGFSIDAFAGAPSGLFRDAEMDLVGGIGGDNAVFRSISGSVSLWYQNATTAPWRTVPSAYDFGGDTGETSTGIASYWMPNHTEGINQGPAMLYGLWNADPWASVASGAIHLAGSVTPNYGLVFVSNTPPVKDPQVATEQDNMSWLPTNNAGKFSTWLPPLGAPWTAKYYIEGFADGFAEKHGTAVTGATTNYALHLVASPGTLNAPLVAWSNAQASNLAMHVTGSSAAPYTFSNLVVNENFTFEHVNDYAFATFPVFQFEGVTNTVDVNNTWQGADSPSGNFVIYDYAFGGAPGMLSTPPGVVAAPYATSGINLFDGGHGAITNQTTAASGYGLAVNLWKDWGVTVEDVTSLYGSYGVFVGDSSGTVVADVSANFGANGVSNVGSTGTFGVDLVANGSFSYAALEESTASSTYYEVAALNGAQGVVAGVDYGAGADYASYYYLAGANGLTVDDAFAFNGSVAVNATLSTNVVVANIDAIDSSWGVRTDHVKGLLTEYVHAQRDSWGVYLWNTHDANVVHTSALGSSVAVWVGNSGSVRVNWVLAQYHSVGVALSNSTHVTINHVTATHHSVAVEVL